MRVARRFACRRPTLASVLRQDAEKLVNPATNQHKAHPRRMRGTDQQQSHVFSYISPEQRVRKDHPLRPIRTMVDEILKQLSPQFNKMYAKVGRPSIPPEQLLRAQLLQMLYSVRSERLLMEEMDYNILFRWFVGLNLDDAVWDATVFTKNRDRLLEAEVAKEFLARVVGQAREKGWTSDEHFSVDGTLLEAWASVKSFQTKDKKEFATAGRPGKSDGGFSRRGEVEPDARIENRSRRASGAQKQRQGGQVELQRKSAGGESQWIDCVEPGVGSHRYSRARCGDGHAAGRTGNRAGDGGRR